MKARVQLYDDVELRLNWNKTFVPCLIGNIPDMKQSIHDLSLLYNQTQNMAVLLRTDDAAQIMPNSFLSAEAKNSERFEFRTRQELPTDFKGVSIMKQDRCLAPSQISYLQSIEAPPLEQERGSSKTDLQREINIEQLHGHQKYASKLAWVATGYSTT